MELVAAKRFNANPKIYSIVMIDPEKGSLCSKARRNVESQVDQDCSLRSVCLD